MPDDTTILSLPLILPAQAQKHVTHNEALLQLDLIVQLAVISRTLTTAPGLASVGDRYIVAAGATGPWAGQSGRIALLAETGWQFTQPLPGWAAQVLAEGQTAVFDGLGWKTPSDGPLSVTQLGVSATADATNRLSVSSPATLLNHAGAGHQLKLNKAAAGDTASLLFQTGFSGRAEMGTAGTDNFSVKVSADGSAFFTAFEAEAASGEVTLPQPLHLGGQAADPATPPNGTLWLNTTTGEVKLRSAGVTLAVGAGGGGVADGDKGDISVTGAGATWTIDAGVVTLGKLSAVATDTFLGRDTAGTGSPEVLTATQARGILNVANGATANATDAALRDRATHTGTQLAATISDFATAVAATAAVTANTAKVTNATHTGDVTGATALTIAADAVSNAKLANMATATLKGRTTAGTGDPEDLTGTQATALLDTFTSGAKGLVPASGGGTTAFLRADGTFAVPAGGGGGATDLTYVAATRTIESSTGVDAVLPLVSITAAGLAAAPEMGPDRYLSFNDFISPAAMDQAVASSGTGAGNSTLSPQDGGIGWYTANLGTTATGRNFIGATNLTGIRFGLGAARFRSRQRVPVLSDAVTTYVFRAGFQDNQSGEAVDGAFFRYTHSVNGGRFEAVTRSNNTETAADTGVTVATGTTYVLDIAVNAAGTSVVFTINGAVVATNTTNIPTASGRETGFGLSVIRSVGTAATSPLHYDYLWVEQLFTGR